MIDDNELNEMIMLLKQIGIELSEKEIENAKKGKLCLELRYVNCIKNCLGRYR